MAKILRMINTPEGYTGEKKEIFGTEDGMKDIYAARQDSYNILSGLVTGIEGWNDGKKKSPCLIVMYKGVKGLITLGESGCQNEKELNKLIGRYVRFIVIGINPEDNIFGASRKQALEKMQEETWKVLSEGKIITGVVKNVDNRVAKVDVGGVIADLSSTEVSYGWISNLREELEVGDNIDVKIVKLDKEAKKVEVSIKAMQIDPWPGVVKRILRGSDRLGKVSGITDYGIFVELEKGVDLLAKQKIGGKRPVMHQQVIVHVVNVNPAKKQISGYIKRNL